MAEFEIYFRDLNSVAQMCLLQTFKTIEAQENWETIPLATICRENLERCPCEENIDRRIGKWRCLIHGDRQPDYEAMDELERQEFLEKQIGLAEQRRDEIRERIDICDKVPERSPVVLEQFLGMGR